MKFIDFFAGIGGFREGLTREGFEPVGWVENDKFKQQAYKTVHNTEGEWHKDDIKSIQPGELPDADLYTGGFPCQSFSIAGNRGGFEDTRGTLFFEIARLVKERQPKYLLLENVRGLLSHDEGRTFGTIIKTLWDIGYNLQWQVLNSKDFGVPQNRERIFIVGHLRGQSRPKVFPIRRKNKCTLKEHTKGMSQGYRVYGTDGLSVTLASEAGGLGAKTGLYQVGTIPKKVLNDNERQRRVYHPDGISPTVLGRNDQAKIVQTGLNTTKDNNCYCIDSNYHKGTSPGDINSGRRTQIKVRTCLTPDRIDKRQNGRRFKEPGEPSFTLTKQDIHGIKYNHKIRKLTPLECFRLQGFPDEWYHKCREEGISDTQMYRCVGDAVTVNVVQEIGRRLKGG